MSPVKHKIRRTITEKERSALIQFSPMVAQLLFHRGIDNTKLAQEFLSPEYGRDNHDPFLLKDAERAAERIIDAIKMGQKIAIYSDYDADGIPAAAMFHDFFSRIGFKNFIFYIPHRHNEGFGVNTDAVLELHAKGAQVLVTLDCGITDIEPVKRARELGIDVIVTDHHEPHEKLPPAFAVIDHKQKDCKYPDKNLCGAGVGFKLIQAILKKDRLGLPEGHEKWFLDLVGMATLSDMVPLIGENRVFAQYGLMVLRKTQRKGLQTLLSKLRIAVKHINEDDIAFMITPRINAASRMGMPDDAFKLLVAQTETDAALAADHLDHINNERKGIVAALVKEIKKKIKDRYGENLPKVIVMGSPEWRPSLLGLVANSCAEEFNRPVFLWGRDGDNLIKGSCRSEGNTNIVNLMHAVPPGVFTQYGGHKYSGGFTVSDEKIYFLEQHLEGAAEKIASDKLIVGEEGAESGDDLGEDFIDAELNLEEINYDLFNSINQLAPFGVGNPKPIFLFRKVVPTAIKIFGKGNEHVELTFKNKNGSPISAISFFGANEKWAEDIKSRGAGSTIDLVASLEKSMFRGRPELRLRVIDVSLI